MLTIMLVEDNTNNVALVEDIFAFDRVAARLVVAASGEEALQTAAVSPPDLFLMDLRLPGIDGLETTQILKGNPLTKHIPVWAITAYAMSGDEEKAHIAGCERYFTKPLSMRGFGDCLRDFLQQFSQRESAHHVTTTNPDC